MIQSVDRQGQIVDASNKEFDLIIIGGGITGAGIALDAALRGISTLLIEKKDFASGTSSRSTKLIHGGLRYLKNMEFKLVHDLGVERAVVHALAPHLTVPEKMLTPIVKNGTYGKLLSSLGIWIYDYLAGVKKDERRKMLDSQQTMACEPLLRKDILLGSALYYEYRTDDARLTIEIIKTANQQGAVCLNYICADDFILQDQLIKGVQCTDALTNLPYIFKAKTIVNACGPWVDLVRARQEMISGKKLHLTKGVHLVVPASKLPVNQAVYFDVFDGRMVFVIPRGEITYFGTTDTHYTSSPDQPGISAEDVAYLLKAVNNMFPNVPLDKEDIISGWAGVRPLIHEEGKSASEISRKDEIFISPHGLISIAGGKLTGYRLMAEKVTDLVAQKIQAHRESRLKKSSTRHHTLSGGAYKDYRQVSSAIDELSKSLKKDFDNADILAKRLIHLYGTQTSVIYDLYKKHKESLPCSKAILKAELQFCIANESVYHLDDFVIRRAGLLYFNPEVLSDGLNDLGEWMIEFLPHKDTMEIAREKEEIISILHSHSKF